MTETQRIVRLEPKGPAGVGLEPMTLDPSDFQSALPEQRIHVCHEDAELGLSVGVWTTTDMQEAFGPYPDNEFMVLVEGRVLMVDGDGREVPIEEGQAFFLRRGIPISWKQEGFLRKFFMIYTDPAAPMPEIASAEGGVIVCDPAALAAGMAPEAGSIGGGTQRDNTVFTSDDGRLTVGLWETTAFESEMRPYSVHEFVQVVAGEAILTEGDGARHRFVAGDVFFIPRGTVCRWSSAGPLQKLYAILDPAAGT